MMTNNDIVSIKMAYTDHTFIRNKRTSFNDVVGVTTGILQIRWTDDGDKDVAALATMYIAEVPNESSIS